MIILKFVDKLKYVYRLIITTPGYKLIIFLQLVSGVSSIIGLPILMPVLKYIETDVSSSDAGGSLAFVGPILNFLGLPLNFYSILSVASVLILVAHALTFFTALIAANAQVVLSERYRKNIFSAYSKTDWLFLTNSRSGEMNYAVLKEAELAGTAHLNAIRTIIYVLQLTALIYISVKLSFIVSVSAAIVYLFLTMLGAINASRVSILSHEYNEKFKGLSNDLHGLQQNKKFFKTSLLNKQIINGIFTYLRDITKNTKKQNIHLELQQSGSLIFTFLFLITLLFLHKQLNLDYARLLLILFIFLRVSAQFSSLICAYASLDGNIPMHKSLQKRLDDLRANEEKDGIEEFKDGSSIRFDNVSFSYPGGNKVFDKLNILIEAHKMTAFIGSSGVGKSTVLDLVLGLLKPDSGSIFYGDTPQDKLNKSSLRAKIAYVSQEVTLVDGSLKENLTIGNPGASDVQIKDIVEKAALAQFTSELPLGLDTHIGENGVKLSGGQRQRIALARALFMDPEILILDEATSSLDSVSERLIQETIKNLSKFFTIIIVTHKLSSVKFADKVYVLENGKVGEAGSYEELLDQKGSLFLFDSLQKEGYQK